MRTLSDDLTLAVATTDMQEGYVITTIYHKGIGVFSGQSYIPGDDSSLYVNLNDIVSQIRGKNDYLKLNDSGCLNTIPLSDGSYGPISVQTRFLEGQINLYSVTVSDGSINKSASEYILSGYDYPNKDIRPSIIENDYDSVLGRIMQGCNWGYGGEDITNPWFQNLLLPRIPYCMTKKFGIGLQLYSDERTNYYIRSESGTNQLKLGFTHSQSD